MGARAFKWGVHLSGKSSRHTPTVTLLLRIVKYSENPVTLAYRLDIKTVCLSFKSKVIRLRSRIRVLLKPIIGPREERIMAAFLQLISSLFYDI